MQNCHGATKGVPKNEEADQCCPPYKTAEIVDYDFPRTPLRVRRPAHEVKDDKQYMKKYTEAVRKMKELDKDHPWNFYQQALIHCAYCNGAYDQVGYKDVPLQVHYSWNFLPWHRYYLHFFERILGRLIDDDTFTLPFWNFDVKEGMSVPEIFTSDPTSPLYNANSLQLPGLFMEDPLRAGEPYLNKGAGGLESIHSGIHQFVGPLGGDHTDMGNFATTAKDCVFYSLHANVDRLWHLYRNFRGNRVEFNEPDWLESSYIFYDENERVVRVKVKIDIYTKISVQPN
ncbi:polyphenol oxidase [Carex littledalei]|uniref:Polyphenol oxidase n=1 Tax=Carex littledalei TaxID=544730 RepID=A0A833RDF0_9POAL|nr:polyphenol oxidase [Carex littledalei]